MANSAAPTVRGHFEKRNPDVLATYKALLAAVRRLGPFHEDPKKTSIHLVRETAFAGIATRRDALILTLKSDVDITSKRVIKRERTSAKRWHLELRLESPKDVDGEVAGWLRSAYALSG